MGNSLSVKLNISNLISQNNVLMHNVFKFEINQINTTKVTNGAVCSL